MHDGGVSHIISKKVTRIGSIVKYQKRLGLLIGLDGRVVIVDIILALVRSNRRIFEIIFYVSDLAISKVSITNNSFIMASTKSADPSHP